MLIQQWHYEGYLTVIAVLDHISIQAQSPRELILAEPHDHLFESQGRIAVVNGFSPRDATDSLNVSK